MCPPPSGDVCPLDDHVVPSLQQLADEMRSAGVRRVHVLAWRDLDDPDAGGSEVHADEFMRRWAAAGLEVTHRTSAAAGQPAMADRNGYRVVRRGSRYSVFPRGRQRRVRRMGPYDACRGGTAPDEPGVVPQAASPSPSRAWPDVDQLRRTTGGIRSCPEAQLAPPFYDGR